jgi:NAD(P)-dependent dehydrogenase (short-subunit alcohol dehydrogenase family)
MATAVSAVVISGAGGALGSELVAYFSRLDARVVAAGRGVDQAKLDAVYGPGRALAASLDLGARASWAELLERLAREGLEVNGAVLAAGGWRGGAPLHETGDELWTGMLAANLETTRASLQALVPGMLKRGKGSIVVVGSAAAARPWEHPRAAAYATAKAASLALVQTTAAEVLGSGVRINVVLPSTIDTPQNRQGSPDADFSRWVAPRSLADVIAFLLSDAARDVSGAALPVYGKLYV